MLTTNYEEAEQQQQYKCLNIQTRKPRRHANYLWQTNCRIRLTNALTEQPILMGRRNLNAL